MTTRNPPRRGFASDDTPTGALPAQLVHQLSHDVGVPDGEIVGMTLARATELMIAYWSQPYR